MAVGLTSSEKFISSLCEKSFLKLWTHPNPKGKKGKELCDCLIVCGSHIVIISVKECKYKDTGDEIGWERWEKAAIKKSASQIWGAERWLDGVDNVIRHDNRVITLPEKNRRQYHRVSVSLGSEGRIPLQWGNVGNGFVHVCTEHGIDATFSVLDTITDFVDFLDSTEDLVNSGAQLLFSGGGVEDLVALYLENNYSFNILSDSNQQPDLLILQDDLWEGLSKSDEYKTIQFGLRDSYKWDSLIECFSNDLLKGKMFNMHNKKATDNELALITMALQPRRYRAELAKSFLEVFQKPELKISARVMKGYGNTAFVFLVGESAEREKRMNELTLRCIVIRGRVPDIKTVVGIAMDRPGSSNVGYSTDILYLHIPEWTSEMEENVINIQSNLGYFQNLDSYKTT